MIKKILSFLLFILTLSSFSQSDQTLIFGYVKNGSKAAEDIHVYNKSTQIGTITNSNGQFKILVKENDTLVFSGIQFYFKELLISNRIIKDKTVTIDLFLKINELDEVEVRAHNLSGNLLTDTNLVKDTISRVASSTLDFSMIDFSKPTVGKVDAISREKAPSAERLTNPNMPIGGNILGLLKFAFDPLIDEMGKIGRKKRQRKKEALIYESKVSSLTNDLVIEFGLPFFTDTLKITKEEIDDFIDYCRPLGIAELYIKGRKIETIDLLIKESKNFKNK